MSERDSHQRHEQVPLPFLIAAGLLVGCTLIAVGVTQLMKSDPGDNGARSVTVKVLRFKDEPNGAIGIYTEPGGTRVETVAPGTNGFLRGTLRALARERRLNGIGDEPPFRLVAREDGSLTLDDPATGRSINLNAFGPANSGVFASLLTSGR